MINTDFPFRLLIQKSTNTTQNGLHLSSTKCDYTYHFGEHGHYAIKVNHLNACEPIEMVRTPDNKYIPLYVLMCVLLFLWATYFTIVKVYTFYQSSRSLGYVPIGEISGQQVADMSQYGAIPAHLIRTPTPSPVPDRSSTPAPLTDSRVAPKKSRIRCLDTFRGISIVVMIFVNYGGGKYWFFNHSKWNGLTVADLVFPWFIFIMGASIFISQQSLRKKGVRKRSIAFKILNRSLILLALGLFLNSAKNGRSGLIFSEWRLPGVLQRFALTYFVVAMVNLLLSPSEEDLETRFSYNWKDSFRDLTFFKWQHLVMLMILASHVIITLEVPVPGCGKGYLGAGGLSDNGAHAHCTGGISGYIDRKVFGLSHIYQHPTCTEPYHCSPYDPEGLFGVLTSVFLAYMGLQCGRILFMYPAHSSRLKRWLVWALIWGAAAAALTKWSKDDGYIPINKNLWSVSFIFATGSMAYILLSVCYVLIDLLHWWSGVPFYFAGMNAILLYCGHEVLGNHFPFNFHTDGSHALLLTRSTVGTCVWCVVSYVLHKKQVYWKI